MGWSGGAGEGGGRRGRTGGGVGDGGGVGAWRGGWDLRRLDYRSGVGGGALPGAALRSGLALLFGVVSGFSPPIGVVGLRIACTRGTSRAEVSTVSSVKRRTCCRCVTHLIIVGRLWPS